jgi:GTPase SAR1 family protein
MVDQANAAKFKPIKIVVIGDGGVGKTSLIKWYVFAFHQPFISS